MHNMLHYKSIVPTYKQHLLERTLERANAFFTAKFQLKRSLYHMQKKFNRDLKPRLGEKFDLTKLKRFKDYLLQNPI